LIHNEHEPVCSACFSSSDPFLIHLLLSLTAPTGLSHRYGSSLYAEDGNRPTPPSSGRSSPYSAQRSAEDLESQNDEQIEGLRAKVNMLKNVSESTFCTRETYAPARLQ
jgi:hypothetical protein